MEGLILTIATLVHVAALCLAMAIVAMGLERN